MFKKKMSENQILKQKIKKKIEKQDLDKEIRKYKKRKPIKFKKISKYKLKDNFGQISKKMRIKWEMISLLIILVLLTVRLGFLQIVQGEELKARVYVQQTLDRSFNPKRGTIYDSTGKNILAVSANVETVSVTPTNIKKEDN